MARKTEAQGQQAGPAAERLAAKLKALYDTLPADEQAAFTALDDVSGHAIMIGGLWFSEPGTDQRHPIPPTRVGIDGPTFNPPRLPRQPRVE